jgi:hypothetical protein
VDRQAYFAAYNASHRAEQAAYRESHREEIRARQRAHDADRREEQRAKARARYAALTPEQREAKLTRRRAWDSAHRDEQVAYRASWWARMRGLGSAEDRVGPCDICGEVVSREWDHDHKNGAHRGWLCESCNKGLGFFYDDPVRLAAAIVYLTNRTSPPG